MSIRKKLHVQEYLYDFSVDGGAASTIDLSAKLNVDPLPQGAIVHDVTLKVITLVASGGAATLTVGNTTDPNGYMESIALGTLTDEAVLTVGEQAGVLLWDDTNDHMIKFLVNSTNDAVFSVTIGTADYTAGKILFYVAYYMPSED